LSVTDVSGQPVGIIFKGPALREDSSQTFSAWRREFTSKTTQVCDIIHICFSEAWKTQTESSWNELGKQTCLVLEL